MPRFVILEHQWNGIHWDLMLELGGVLRTWAIDAPIVPDVDLPARQLPDHRIAYLAYEGEVSGGRGTVRRLDRGEYTARVWTESLVEVELRGAQLAGTVEVRSTGAGAIETPFFSWTVRFGNFD